MALRPSALRVMAGADRAFRGVRGQGPGPVPILVDAIRLLHRVSSLR